MYDLPYLITDIDIVDGVVFLRTDRGLLAWMDGIVTRHWMEPNMNGHYSAVSHHLPVPRRDDAHR